MDQAKLHARLRGIFLIELNDRLEALDRDLLALERTPDESSEILERLFRTAHSLKGAAGSAGVPEIAAICHRLESWFGAAQSDPATLLDEKLQQCFAAADSIRAAAAELRGATAPAEPPPPVESGLSDHVEAPAPAGQALARIPAEKLDSLLIKSGALLVARHMTKSRGAEAEALVELSERCAADGAVLIKALRGTVDRRLAAAASRHAESMARLGRELRHLAAGIAQDAAFVEYAALPLEEEVRQVRMMPFREALTGLDRLVRDLARSSGKSVRLVTSGEAVELDRSVLDGLRDPLMHLVRNAVDHGIEAPEIRRGLGKPPTGQVTLSAELRGGSIEIAVTDDGKGFDIAAIRAVASRRGLPPTDDDALIRAVFLPGFSTAASVTEISGRGVGLDVVLRQIEAMRGTVRPDAAPGGGARFVLTLPLTLTSIRILRVKVGDRYFAIDLAAVTRLLFVPRTALGRAAGRLCLTIEGRSVPTVPLADLLQMEPTPLAERLSVILFEVAGERLALIVDQMLEQQDVILRSLGDRFRRVPYVAGATILPTRRVMLILNGVELVGGGLAARPSAPILPVLPDLAPRKRLLLAEDSMTTRMLLRHILEAAGYDVAAAVDGSQAWATLELTGADVVVSDIDMPVMNGFALTETIRGSERFRDLPVILVTSRETEEDRLRGLQVGANAYLVKSAFDQRNLLDAVARHV